MTKNIENKIAYIKTKETNEIVSSILKELPIIAKELIVESQDMSNIRNKSFFENPDNVNEHNPKWHQWGIVTHTKMCEKNYREEVPQYLKTWGIYEKIKNKMSENIDGLSKEKLLNISILFHDLGKFTERRIVTKNDNSVSFSFKDHETASGRIIRDRDFSKKLKANYGLTDTQIEYIARCAELHYKLGSVRDEAKKSEFGFTFEFLKSETFHKFMRQLYIENTGFQLEIGILFLADSLAKTEIPADLKDISKTKNQSILSQDTIKNHLLESKFVGILEQLPVSCAIVETYLKFCLDNKN